MDFSLVVTVRRVQRLWKARARARRIGIRRPWTISRQAPIPYKDIQENEETLLQVTSCPACSRCLPVVAIKSRLCAHGLLRKIMTCCSNNNRKPQPCTFQDSLQASQ